MAQLNREATVAAAHLAGAIEAKEPDRFEAVHINAGAENEDAARESMWAG